MSPKLNQIVAVEKGAKAQYNEAITGVYHAIQKPGLFDGLTRVYTPKDDEGDQLPPENQIVTYTVPELLTALSEQWGNLMNVEATKDFGNMGAKADVKLPDGSTLIHDAPVPFLIWLEKQLVDLHTMIGKLPTLDPSVTWAYDESAGCFKSTTVRTTRPKKIPRAFVKYEATPEHPAQVDTFTEDVIVGFWDATKFSGALPKDRVTVLQDRVRQLQQAVKYAREEANGMDVTNVNVGEAVFEWLLA